jgi:hypothetical protein
VVESRATTERPSEQFWFFITIKTFKKSPIAPYVEINQENASQPFSIHLKFISQDPRSAGVRYLKMIARDIILTSKRQTNPQIFFVNILVASFWAGPANSAAAAGKGVVSRVGRNQGRD